MKGKTFLTGILLSATFCLHAQTDQIVQIENNVFNFGIGFGYRVNTINTTEAYVLATDSSLQFQKLPKSAFVISATAVFHLGNNVEPKVVHTTSDGETSLLSFKSLNKKHSDELKAMVKDQTGQDFVKPSPWSIFLALNVADITSNGAAFDKPIDGGLGIGYKVGEFLSFGLFGEYSTYRQLKDYYVKNYYGQPITVSGQKLGALDNSNNSYFFSRPIVGIAFKIVATLGASKSGKN